MGFWFLQEARWAFDLSREWAFHFSRQWAFDFRANGLFIFRGSGLLKCEWAVETHLKAVFSDCGL